METEDFINLLNKDIKNEYAHFHFYLHSAMVVTGLHREELQEFFRKQATSEMQHIEAFGKLIVGLGGVPESMPSFFPTNLSSPQDILKHAMQMEEEVVRNYVGRISEATELRDFVSGKYVEIFLEDQIMDSRSDLDHLREMLKNV